jgi:hypothetical protein
MDSSSGTIYGPEFYTKICGYTPDFMDASKGVKVRSVNGDQYTLFPLQYSKWGRLNTIVEGGISDDKIIDIPDIDSNVLHMIIKFLYIYSVKENWFGIHMPLKFKEIPKDPDAPKAAPIVQPDDEEIPEFKEGEVDLVYSGVHQVYCDYLEEIKVENIVELFLTAINDEITMLVNLIAAFFAKCCAMYGWKKIHSYYLMIRRQNKFLINKERPKEQQEYIDSVIIDKIGKKEYIYETDRAPAPEELEMHEKRKAEIPFISECEVLNDYKALKKRDDDLVAPKYTDEEIEARKYNRINHTQHFYPNVKDIPKIDSVDPDEVQQEKKDGTKIPTQLSEVEAIFENGHADLYGDSDDDDPDSYKDIFDDPDCPPYDPVIYEAFMDKKEVRQNCRKHIIACRIQNRKDLKTYTYNYLRNVEDYSYFNEKHFQILLAFVNDPKFDGFETVTESTDIVVPGEPDKNFGKIPDHKLRLMAYVPPDTYDPCEDGYADTVPEQSYLPDEVYPITIDAVEGDKMTIEDATTATADTNATADTTAAPDGTMTD